MNHKKVVKLRYIFKKLKGDERLGDLSRQGWKRVKREYNRLNWKERSAI